jgi:hypothetical protein
VMNKNLHLHVTHKLDSGKTVSHVLRVGLLSASTFFAE